MNSDDIIKNGGEMLSQPLTTEDGFINPACMNEFEAVIKGMPPDYERLKDKPEWSTPIFLNLKQITGALAHWAVRQGDYYPYPPGLEHVIGYLDACLRPIFLAKTDLDLKYKVEGYGRFSLCEINKMLWDILEDTKEFDDWNTKECLGKDWLDLHALLLNVCNSIRFEEQRNREFDRKFEEDWANRQEKENG